MTRLRKLSATDRKLLAKVFKECGSVWAYKALAVWFGIIPYDDLRNFKRWTNKRCAALRFLKEITDDYTFKAIYDAADEIVNVSRSPKRRRAG